MQVLAAAATVAGPLVQGIAGHDAALTNSRTLDRQALEAQYTGVAQEAQIREQARKAIGEQIAGQFGNGMTGGTGSAIDAVRESQINAALDALSVRREAAAKAENYRADASAQRRQGTYSLISGVLGAVSAASGLKSDWAAAKRGTTPSVGRGY